MDQMTEKSEDNDIEKFKERIRSVFAPNGDLAKVTPGYVMRPAQLEFALEIADTLVTKRHLIAEAGTAPEKPLPIWFRLCCTEEKF